MLQVRIKKESSHDSDDIEIEIEESVDDMNVPCPLTASSPFVYNTDSVASRTSETSVNENRVTVTEFQRECSDRIDIKSLSDDDMPDTKVQSTEKKMCGQDTDRPGKQCENTQRPVLVYNENNFEPDFKQETSEFSAPRDCSESKEGGKGNSCSVALSHQDILESIFNLPPPTEELILDAKAITEEEKVIHAEFFEGRSAKTPKRYLKVSVLSLSCDISLHYSHFEILYSVIYSTLQISRTAPFETQVFDVVYLCFIQDCNVFYDINPDGVLPVLINW